MRTGNTTKKRKNFICFCVFKRLQSINNLTRRQMREGIIYGFYTTFTSC